MPTVKQNDSQWDKEVNKSTFVLTRLEELQMKPGNHREPVKIKSQPFFGNSCRNSMMKREGFFE